MIIHIENINHTYKQGIIWGNEDLEDDAGLRKSLTPSALDRSSGVLLDNPCFDQDYDPHPCFNGAYTCQNDIPLECHNHQ